MKNTPIDKVLVDNTIRSLGIQDFEKATIREVKSVAASVERSLVWNSLSLKWVYLACLHLK